MVAGSVHFLKFMVGNFLLNKLQRPNYQCIKGYKVCSADVDTYVLRVDSKLQDFRFNRFSFVFFSQQRTIRSVKPYTVVLTLSRLLA